MPQLLLLVVADAAVEGAFAAGLIGFAAAAAIGNLIVGLTVNFLLGALGKLLSGSDASATPQTGQQFTIRETVGARTICYGQCRTSGTVVYEYTSGNRNQYLWVVVAVAGHQCDAMTDVWLDNVQITTGNINAGTGAVTGGQYAGKVFVYRFLGTSTQAVAADLSAARGEWTSTHQGKGVAYVVFKMEQDSTVFPTGAPQNFFVNLKGKRLYDPRLDSTNGGAGTHRLADATTWAWSENPALAYADYVTGGSVTFDVATPVTILGMKQPSTRINWPLVSNAANICEQTPAIPGATTQKRYTFNGMLSCADTNAINMQKILATCVGQHVNSGGKFRLYAGAYDAPTITLTDSDLIGQGYEVLNAGRASLYNLVTSVYVDPTRNYQQVNSAPLTDGTYVTADSGEQITKTVDLTAVQDEYRAQRICTLILKQSRNLLTVKLYLGLNGFKIGLWETFNLTLIEPGWSSKVFRCVDWQMAPDSPGVTITAREESSSAYTDPAAIDYVAPGSVSGLVNISEYASVPAALTATPLADAVLFSWTQSTYFPPGATYRLYQYTAATPFSSATMIWEGTSAHYSLGITNASNPTLYYWITAFNRGNETAPIPGTTTGLAAKALSVTAGFRATASSLYKIGTGASQTTPAATLTVTGGTPAYTYAWTRTGGDASTTCSNSAIANPTFSRSSMTVGGSPYDSAWQCIVTDSLAATATATMNVSISRDNGL